MGVLPQPASKRDVLLGFESLSVEMNENTERLSSKLGNLMVFWENMMYGDKDTYYDGYENHPERG